MSQQSLMQASIRAVTGTTYTYEGDWHALFDNDGIPLGQFNERMLRWINVRLGGAYTEINGAMAAMALAEGADSFNAIGTFTATSQSLLAPTLTWDGDTADVTPDFTITLDATAAVNDGIYLQYSATSDFASVTELTDTLDAGEVAGLSVSMATADLAEGTWYFRAKHTRPVPAISSDWSATETVTIALSSAAYMLLMRNAA